MIWYVQGNLCLQKGIDCCWARRCLCLVQIMGYNENILDTDSSYSWYELIDKESGRLMKHIEKTIANSNPAIAKKFGEIVEMRNRIIHGFRVTSLDGEQVIATKVKSTGEQFIITEKYLIDFIKKNNELSDMLHNYRGY